MNHTMSGEDMVSRLKLAKLVAAFQQNLDENFIEAILKTQGDINYAIPMSKHLESVNTTLRPGTIVHQMQKLSENKISKILNLLIKYGAVITVKNSQGQTALHSELIYQHKKSPKCNFNSPLINAFLSAHVEHKIRRNPRDDNGITHFHIACLAKHTEAIDFFLNTSEFYEQQLIKWDSPIFPGCSSVHLAVNRRCVETVKKLLDHGVNSHLNDAKGSTPVQNLIKRNMTITNGQIKGFNLKYLVEEYELNQEMIFLLSTNKTINNNNNASQIITDRFFDFLTKRFSNFHAACTLDDTSLAKSLMMFIQDDKVTISDNSSFLPGYTPMHFAAYFNFDLVKLLLNNGGNIMTTDANGVTPFDICLKTQSIANIEHLLSTNPTWRNIVLSDGKTKLLGLVSSMKSKIDFEKFLSQLDDINLHVDKSSPLWPGYTSLHLAVLFSERFPAEFHELRPFKDEDSFPNKLPLNASLVNQCLAHEANVCAQDSNGATPIHLAFYLQKNCIYYLFDNVPDEIVDCVDDNGISLLHIVCGSSNETDVVVDFADNLILNGADINLAISSSKVKHLLEDHEISIGSTPLHLAVMSGNVEVAKSLIRRGADVNIVDEDDWSPIHMVILSSSPEKMGRALLTFTARLQEHVVEDVGLSHLHVACHVDSLRGVKKLIKLGSDVNAGVVDQDYNGFTPLHFAVQQDSSKVTSLLLTSGAEILAKNAEGISPLYHVLATTTNDELIELFVKHLLHNNDLQERLEKDSGMTLLHIVAFTMKFELVARLIHNGVNVNAKVSSDSPIWPGCTALHTWHYGCTEFDYGKQRVNKTLKLLLDAGADVTLTDAKLNTPVHLFSDSHVTIHDEDTLLNGRSLLENQKDFRMNPINAAGVSHFHIAVRMCDVSVVDKFLKSGVNVNQRVDYWYNARKCEVIRPDCTPLHLLTYPQSRYLKNLPDRIETADLLLRYGADANARDIFGDTPLHAAVKSEFLQNKVAEKIIRAGGNVEAGNIAGETPFAVLVKSSTISSKSVEFFLHQGCHVNVYNIVDKTGFLTLPLWMYERFRNQADDIYEVLFKSPDIASFDQSGRTAIHNIVSSPSANRDSLGRSYVGMQDYCNLFQRLMKLGCDIDARDHTGKTALHIAAGFKKKFAVEALLMNGADINILTKSGMPTFDYGLRICQCNVIPEGPHYHLGVINKILKYVQLMQFIGLYVNKSNENLIERALNLCETSTLNLTKVKEELEKTKQIQIGDSNSLQLYDFLSETGAVAAHPTMPRALRQAVYQFFTSENPVLEELNEIIGLFKLQYRKIVKRSALFRFGIDSLRALSGIPLPELVCENLMRCLSFTDVQNLVAATKNSFYGVERDRVA